MKTYLTLLICFFGMSMSNAQTYQVVSPDGHLQVKIENGSSLHFSIQNEGQLLVPSVSVNMKLGNGIILGKNNKVRKTKTEKVNEVIHPVVPIRRSVIPDHYNEFTLQFKDRFSVIFRIYNNAVAYRFKTGFQDSIIVKDENCNIRLPGNTDAWFSFLRDDQKAEDQWVNNYEHLYQKEAVAGLEENKITQLPLLIGLHNKGKVLITESDLYDYPGLYFKGGKDHTLQSVFPPRRVKNEVKNAYDYIAQTTGERSFPWRIFAFASQDVQLLDNDIVYKLADPNRIENIAWIKAGQVAWDWWSHWNITGVDFQAGINTETYKYYIDFASRNHIPYLMMDNGWSESDDLTQVNPDIDMQELTEYAQQRNVDIILWCPWRTLDNQMQEAMDFFQQWGIKGIKVDYMNRDDQDMVNFYWRCAKAAAEHQLIVDFHGSHKPVGLQRTYPNVLNFEGVPGLENDKWSESRATPGMAVTIPYIRMFAGPMDYTPGAMRNAQKEEFRKSYNHPMSQGTRCHQLAMFVIYNAPLQMLSGSPTLYEKNKACLDFITSVPTTWDETIPLEGKIGQYVALARRSGNEYFAAAMTNLDTRNLTLDFSFLPEGSWHIVIFQDGVNADRNGIDFKKVEKEITSKTKLTIHLAPGGGWAARIFK